MHGKAVRSVSPRFARATRRIILLALVLTLGLAFPSLIQAVSLQSGDVLVGLGVFRSTGLVAHFQQDSTLVQFLDNGYPGPAANNEETGMCFDQAGNLYTTNFFTHSISKFLADGTLSAARFIDLTNYFTSSSPVDFSHATPHSCVLDATGHLYIGLSDSGSTFGGGGLLKFDISDATPVLLNVFTPTPEGRGTDWIDLAGDQCTMLYTSPGSATLTHSIKRFNVCVGQQMPDYCAHCGDGGGGEASGPFMALRIIPGGSGVLVADMGMHGAGVLRRYSGDVATGTGEHVGTYSAVDSLGAICGVNLDAPCFSPFALNLDPDGSHFWTADNFIGDVFRFAIEGVEPPQQFSAYSIELPPPYCATCRDRILTGFVGLTIVGELTDATTPPSSTNAVTAVITASNKVYDGSVGATITNCALTPAPAVEVDVSCQASGAAFDSANAGMGKAVTATVGLSGSASATYALTSTTASTTANITRRPVEATADAKNKTYGDADPPLTYQISGGALVPGDAFSGALTRAAGEAVGSYAIQQGSLALNGNYALAFIGAGLGVSRRAASVTPDPKTKTFGADDPTLTGSLSGFLAADSVTAAYNRTAGENVLGGPYTISATLSPAGVLDNYAVTYATALLSITAATPAITWPDPAAITYPAPLGATQLNATADTDGAFTYTPPAGTVLGVGSDQVLSVLFTPTVTGNYTTATAQVHVAVLPADVTLSCPNVSLFGSALTISGVIAPGAGAMSVLYTAPSGAITTHTAQSDPSGSYADSLLPDEYGPWTVRASWNGVQSDACPVVVYGKATGGTFVIGDGSAALGQDVDFWGSRWWKDNTWTGAINPSAASLKGYLDAVDLPGHCGGSWSTPQSKSSRPPSSLPPYMAVLVSSAIAKNGSTISGDVVAEVIIRTDPGYSPNVADNGTGTIVAVRCHR